MGVKIVIKHKIQNMFEHFRFQYIILNLFHVHLFVCEHKYGSHCNIKVNIMVNGKHHIT